MSQFDNTPIMSEPAGAPNPTSGVPGPAGWVQTWIKAISQPNEQTFIDISESPYAQSKTAYLWIFIATTLTYLVSGIIQAVIAGMGIGGQNGMGAALGGSLVAVVCLSPIVGALSVLFFALGVAIIQWIAKLFGGAGTYNKLTYAVASFSVPISLVSMFLIPFSSVPYLNICTGLISIGVSFYSLFLEITAVKAVNRFGWGQAIGSVVIPFVAILVVCGCVVGIGIAILGPMIGDIFNQINQSLQGIQ